MNVSQFITKWRQVALTERSAAQQHFLDLCELLDHPKPAEADPTGESFTFERGAAKHGGGGSPGGGQGWADVWKRNFFGWEYKGRHKDLDAAYDQLLKYREALENPPLLVVCDMDRIVIHTNFTATASRVHEITLDEIGAARNLEILRAVFHDPDKLRPGATSEAITTAAASHVADIAQALRSRGLDPHEVAHFLDRIVFCMFAEDIALLPRGLFSRVVENARRDAARFTRQLGALFDAMANGGDFGADPIRHFNGNLFTDCGFGIADFGLSIEEIESIRQVAALDWSAVDPSIFGTLFERGMDPAKRSQLGAHYTSREDIETLVEPVVMQPLRREWEEVRATVECLLTTGRKPGASGLQSAIRNPKSKIRSEADVMIRRFLTRLANVTVLDPACGSGNFLYVTLQKLKDLEKEVIVHAMEQGFSGYLPLVGPWQLYGIEINPYAHDLAQMTVWIGYLQWTRANGFGVTDDPILRSSNNIQCMDAILDISDCGMRIAESEIANPKSAISEPEWPTVDFIVGNPPFLGDKKMRAELGDEYVEALRKLFAGRIPGQSDLCCYWFEKARQHIADGKCKRAGLLATTGIKQVGARRILERINNSCRIFFAISDRDWILDGASVRISMVGFEAKDGKHSAELDGKQVAHVNADLTAGADSTKAKPLPTNSGLCFMGTTKVGAFDIDDGTAIELLTSVNPHGRPNSDVIRPFRNGSDLVRVCSNRWIIDFGVGRSMEEASLYEAPFEYLVQNVKLERQRNNDKLRAERWWLLGRTLPDFRAAAAGCSCYIGTPRVAKHRVFVWLDTVVLPDSKVIAITRSDDFTLGNLQSRVHQVWTFAMCGWHGIGNDATYNPTTCFETFPFPGAPSCSVAPRGRLTGTSPYATEGGFHVPDWVAPIADAARELHALRNAWLNPPEWTKEEILEFPGSVNGPWARYIAGNSEIRNPQSEIGMVRYPRLVPRDADSAAKLAKRTLTNLYNQRPTWLDIAHRKLDEAVFASYGWDAVMSDEEILERLLELNVGRAVI